MIIETKDIIKLPTLASPSPLAYFNDWRVLSCFLHQSLSVRHVGK